MSLTVVRPVFADRLMNYESFYDSSKNSAHFEWIDKERH